MRPSNEIQHDRTTTNRLFELISELSDAADDENDATKITTQINNIVDQCTALNHIQQISGVSEETEEMPKTNIWSCLEKAVCSAFLCEEEENIRHILTVAKKIIEKINIFYSQLNDKELVRLKKKAKLITLLLIRETQSQSELNELINTEFGKLISGRTGFKILKNDVEKAVEAQKEMLESKSEIKFISAEQQNELIKLQPLLGNKLLAEILNIIHLINSKGIIKNGDVDKNTIQHIRNILAHGNKKKELALLDTIEKSYDNLLKARFLAMLSESIQKETVNAIKKLTDGIKKNSDLAWARFFENISLLPRSNTDPEEMEPGDRSIETQFPPPEFPSLEKPVACSTPAAAELPPPSYEMLFQPAKTETAKPVTVEELFGDPAAPIQHKKSVVHQEPGPVFAFGAHDEEETRPVTPLLGVQGLFPSPTKTAAKLVSNDPELDALFKLAVPKTALPQTVRPKKENIDDFFAPTPVSN